MENLSIALGFLIITSGLVLIVFIIAKYSYLVKKAMIDKGITPEPVNNNIKYTDAGCIVTGLGLGFIVSSVFTEMNFNEDTTDLLVWGTILIFGGMGLMAAQVVRRRLEK